MPEIDPGRLLGDLRELAKFGAYKTGVHRPTFSREDVEARHWFAERLTAAGLDATIDGIGNVLGIEPRARPQDALRLASGEPEPCRLARRPARLRLRASRPRARLPKTRRPPISASTSRPVRDEEGHFGSFLGSRSFIGLLSEEEIDKAQQPQRRHAAARGARQGRAFRPAAPAVRGRRATRAIRGAYRAGRHARERRPQDRRRHGDRRDLAVPPHGDGRAEPRRHDLAWRAAATPGSRSCGSWARSTGASPSSAGPRTVWTCGRITLEPGAPSIIPGRAEALFQFRDADPAVLDRLQAELQRLVEEANRDGRCPIAIEVMSQSTPALMDERPPGRDRGGGRGALPGQALRMPSGAGHDAQ